MKIESEVLISDLKQRTKEILQQAETMKSLAIEVLNKKSSPESWSALECLEHLSLYSDFYNPEFEKSISKGRRPAGKFFKSGFLGDYSAKSMIPKEKLNKMKTFKDKNPLGSKLGFETIERFIQQQNAMLELLEKAQSVDLTKSKSATTLPMIKFRLGDTFRFVIYHNQRHMLQAKKAIG